MPPEWTTMTSKTPPNGKTKTAKDTTNGTSSKMTKLTNDDVYNNTKVTNGGSSNMTKLANGGGADPPETDLDYYARPENYGGSSLLTLQKIIYAQEKQKKGQPKSKKKKHLREEDELLRRYKHILAFDESLNPPSSSSSDDEEDGEEKGENAGGERRSGGVTSGREGDIVPGKGNNSPKRRLSVSRANNVALSVAEAQRPLSDSRRTSNAEIAVSLDRRSVSAGEDVARGDVSSLEDAGGLPQPDSITDNYSSAPALTTSGATFTPSTVTFASGFEASGSGQPDRGADVSLEASTNSAMGSSTRKVWTRALVKNRFAAMSAEVRSSQIRGKFSQAIKAVLSIRKLAAIMIKKSEEPSAMIKSYTGAMDSKTFSETLKSQGLSFDPSYFKANREISVSNEVKTILSLPPSSRTQEQIQTAMYGLQSLPSFAEYPLHMQEKLAKVAWYEVVPPKRTIIRQGHYAENFYFILSGQAVVTILIRDPKTNESQVRTANFMRKGTSFGELALLHHSRRTATVTSQDTVQLLSIGREDFFDIFMSRQGQDRVPEHIKFISQLDFMRGWPLERLLEHPEHCLLHFFRRNMVIVKDSKQSEWLYIVKSGSCQVLKQLRGVTPRLGLRKHESLDESLRLPQTGTAIRGPKVDTGLHRPAPKYNTNEDEYFHLWGTPGRESKGQSTQSSHKNAVNGTAADGKARKKQDNNKFSKESYADEPDTGGPHFAAGKASQSTGPKVPRLKLKGGEAQRPSSSSGSRSKPQETDGAETKPPSSPPPVFVQVSRLKPRDMFGLEQIRFQNFNLDSEETSVSLVSRGAECIMLSKEFFRRHATELVKKNLQQLIRPYPDEDTLQDSLQTKVDWDLFKHTLIEDITSPPVV